MNETKTKPQNGKPRQPETQQKIKAKTESEDARHGPQK